MRMQGSCGLASSVGDWSVGWWPWPPPASVTRPSERVLVKDGRRGPPDGSLRESVRRWKGECCDSSKSEPASEGGMCVCDGGGLRRNDVRRDEAADDQKCHGTKNQL